MRGAGRDGEGVPLPQLVEVPVDERAPVLRAYLDCNPSTADLFATPFDFAAEAERKPVFRVSRP